MNKVISKALIALFMIALVSCAPVESSSASASSTAAGPTNGGKTPVVVNEAELETKDVTGGIEIVAYNGSEINIVIPATIDSKDVVSIGDNAFKDKKLVALSLPESVNNIGANAFTGNTFTTVTMAATTVPTLGADAFDGAIATLYVPVNTSTAYKADTDWSTAFTTIAVVLTKDVATVTDVTDGVSINSYTGTDKDIVIPATLDDKAVVAITDKLDGSGVFQNKSLTSVVLPDSITSIGDFAFDTNSLTSIVLPSALTIVGTAAFDNNSIVVTDLRIPNGVTTVRDSAFSSFSIENLFLGSNITSLGVVAFPDDTTNTTITATTPPTLYSTYITSLGGTNLYVPSGTVAAYKGSFWDYFFTNIEAITP